MSEGGAGSLRNTMVQLKGISGQIEKFNQVFDSMDMNIDALDNVDDIAIGDAGSADKAAWKKMLED